MEKQFQVEAVIAGTKKQFTVNSTEEKFFVVLDKAAVLATYFIYNGTCTFIGGDLEDPKEIAEIAQAIEAYVNTES